MDSETERYLTIVAAHRTSRPEGFVYSCIEDFVLKNGRHMGDRSERSALYKNGRIKECYRNALFLAHDHRDLIYCEGYALGAILPVLHAWCVDNKGNVIDPTWNDGKDYFGVMFSTRFAVKHTLARGCYGLIDDWKNHFPLLRGKHRKEILHEIIG